MNRRIVIVLTAVYIGTVVAANITTQQWGLHWLPFGLLVPAGTWFAGMALILRDQLQEAVLGGDGSRRTTARWWICGAILAGAILSAVTTSAALALASGVAFLFSELADYAVYSRLRERSILAAVLVSSLVGAPIDTALFLSLAPEPLSLTWPALLGQVLVKVVLLAPVGYLLAVGVRRRAVPSQPQFASGA